MALRLTFAVAALLMSGTVFSAVTLTAPEEIKILAVNDQEVNTGLFRSVDNHYKVDAGEISLSVRYSQYFEHLNGEHDIVKSGVVTLKTPPLKDGEKYQLKLVNTPANFEAAKKYAEQPIVALFDKNNQMLIQQTGANTESKPWLAQGIFAKATDLTQKRRIPVNQPAPVYSQAGTSAATALNSNILTNATNTADQQLIQLWQQSSKAERQKFMGWLAEQAN